MYIYRWELKSFTFHKHDKILHTFTILLLWLIQISTTCRPEDRLTDLKNKCTFLYMHANIFDLAYRCNVTQNIPYIFCEKLIDKKGLIKFLHLGWPMSQKFNRVNKRSPPISQQLVVLICQEKNNFQIIAY